MKKNREIGRFSCFFCLYLGTKSQRYEKDAHSFDIGGDGILVSIALRADAAQPVTR